MPRYVSREAMVRPGNQDFDQASKAGEAGHIVVAQGLLVAPERHRTIGGRDKKPRLTQNRQSRIVAVLDETDGKTATYPAKSTHPDIGVRFSRRDVLESSARDKATEARRLEGTTLHQKTTINLSGMPPLEPTNRLVDLKVPFETVAVVLIQTPSEFKLKTLTTGDGGLASPASRDHYRAMLACRIAAEAEAVAANVEPSDDLSLEIPW